MSSSNDKSLLLDQKQSTVIYSDKNVEITEPPLETYKKEEAMDVKSQGSEDIKVSLVVTCCPCPLPVKCETTDPCCDCKKDECDCGCAKKDDIEMSYVSAICSLFSCTKKSEVVEIINN